MSTCSFPPHEVHHAAQLRIDEVVTSQRASPKKAESKQSVWPETCSRSSKVVPGRTQEICGDSAKEALPRKDSTSGAGTAYQFHLDRARVSTLRWPGARGVIHRSSIIARLQCRPEAYPRRPFYCPLWAYNCSDSSLKAVATLRRCSGLFYICTIISITDLSVCRFPLLPALAVATRIRFLYTNPLFLVATLRMNVQAPSQVLG